MYLSKRTADTVGHSNPSSTTMNTYRVRPIFWLGLLLSTLMGVSKLAETYDYVWTSRVISWGLMPLCYVAWLIFIDRKNHFPRRDGERDGAEGNQLVQ